MTFSNTRNTQTSAYARFISRLKAAILMSEADNIGGQSDVAKAKLRHLAKDYASFGFSSEEEAIIVASGEGCDDAVVYGTPTKRYVNHKRMAVWRLYLLHAAAYACQCRPIKSKNLSVIYGSEELLDNALQLWEDLKDDVLRLAKKEKPVGESRAWTNAFMLSLSGKIIGEERRKYFERLESTVSPVQASASTNRTSASTNSLSKSCLSVSEYFVSLETIFNDENPCIKHKSYGSYSNKAGIVAGKEASLSASRVTASTRRLKGS